MRSKVYAPISATSVEIVGPRPQPLSGTRSGGSLLSLYDEISRICTGV